MNESMIITTAPFSFADFIGGKWEPILGERDKQSSVLKTVDFSRTKFVSGLRKEDGEYVAGAGEVKTIQTKEVYNAVKDYLTTEKVASSTIDTSISGGV